MSLTQSKGNKDFLFLVGMLSTSRWLQMYAQMSTPRSSCVCVCVT